MPSVKRAEIFAHTRAWALLSARDDHVLRMLRRPLALRRVWRTSALAARTFSFYGPALDEGDVPHESAATQHSKRFRQATEGRQLPESPEQLMPEDRMTRYPPKLEEPNLETEEQEQDEDEDLDEEEDLEDVEMEEDGMEAEHTSTARRSGDPYCIDLQSNAIALQVDFKRSKKGPIQSRRYPNFWLRNSCACTKCVDPSTRQRRTQSRQEQPRFAIAPDKTERIQRDGQDLVRVLWEDGHESEYSLSWLWTHGDPATRAKAQNSPPHRIAWRVDELQKDTLSWPLSAEDRGKALYRLLAYGVVFLSGVPKDGEAIRDVAAQFGDVRNTFYGETWDVKSVPNSKNVAYTDQKLAFHQDLLYMRNPPAYQVLHCIENRVSGGESSFVDGLRAAYELGASLPTVFSTLSRYPVPFQYVNAGEARYCSHLTIKIARSGDGNDSARGLFVNLGANWRGRIPHEVAKTDYHISHVNFSPPFQAPLPYNAPVEMHFALRAFAHQLTDRRLAYRYKMKEGDCVVFDNRRVLHAREEFDANEGPRWLKGCYLDEDAVVDTWRKYGVSERSEHKEDSTMPPLGQPPFRQPPFRQPPFEHRLRKIFEQSMVLGMHGTLPESLWRPAGDPRDISRTPADKGTTGLPGRRSFRPEHGSNRVHSPMRPDLIRQQLESLSHVEDDKRALEKGQKWVPRDSAESKEGSEGEEDKVMDKEAPFPRMQTLLEHRHRLLRQSMALGTQDALPEPSRWRPAGEPTDADWTTYRPEQGTAEDTEIPLTLDSLLDAQNGKSAWGNRWRRVLEDNAESKEGSEGEEDQDTSEADRIRRMS
ncbi:Clavaminate synthase-like protein [Calocera viscosa TUFC12733]|uniref:Clavaminate synthase-like protein n=1 Tax=Calocera viscosa (strain TUFC12733) TaxID=1330018 RepID=A0A167PX08_CALVF|nr:Clavaminate synthase-like protein [Calocera viscosa TUFC12733]